jgi:hypothetical protein
VPADFDKTGLEDALQQRRALQPPHGDLAGGRHGGNSVGNGVQVHTLIPDLRRGQIVTIHFQRLPHRLRTFTRGSKLVINVDLSGENKLVSTTKARFPNDHICY